MCVSYMIIVHYLSYTFFSELEQFVEKGIDNWVNFYVRWLTTFSKPLLVVRYENLKSDLLGEVGRMCRFLGFDFGVRQKKCVLEHTEGNFHRKNNKQVDIITNAMKTDLNIASEQLQEAIINRHKFNQS